MPPVDSADSGGPPRGTVSIRAHLSRAMLLVLVLALVPTLLSLRTLSSLEDTRPATPSPATADSLDSARIDADAPRAPAMRAPDRAIRNAVTFGLLAAVAAALVVVYTPVVLLKSLAQVTAILKQAESGNLNVAIAGSRVREVSALAVAVNRTLGRLRHFDALKTQRIREEQRLGEALFAASERALGLVNPEARIARANAALRSLAETNGEACSGRSVREVFGGDAHEAVRRVQRDRDVETLPWRPEAEGPAYRITLRPVKDEVDAPPRVLLAIEPLEAEAADVGASAGDVSEDENT